MKKSFTYISEMLVRQHTCRLECRMVLRRGIKPASNCIAHAHSRSTGHFFQKNSLHTLVATTKSCWEHVILPPSWLPAACRVNQHTSRGTMGQQGILSADRCSWAQLCLELGWRVKSDKLLGVQAKGENDGNNKPASIGSAQAQFQLQAVQDLRRGLRNLGSDLVIRIGRPEQATCPSSFLNICLFPLVPI